MPSPGPGSPQCTVGQEKGGVTWTLPLPPLYFLALSTLPTQGRVDIALDEAFLSSTEQVFIKQVEMG